jgi:hypothetical protein
METEPRTNNSLQTATSNNSLRNLFNFAFIILKYKTN